MNGRFANLPLNEAVSRVLEDYGFTAFDASELSGSVPGFVIDRMMAAREALQPLELAYFFDTVETAGRIRMRHRGSSSVVASLEVDDIVEEQPGQDRIGIVRSQETDLPASAKVRYIGASGDYRGLVSEARKLSGWSSRVADANLAIMLESDQASTIAENWLHETWAARDKATFSLPPSQLAVEPGDMVALTVAERERLFRVIDIADSGRRSIEAQSIDPIVYKPGTSPSRVAAVATTPVVGTADALFLDLPLLKGDEPEDAGYIAVSQSPWPGDVVVYQSPEDSGYTLAATATLSATIGETLSDFAVGPEGRFDNASVLRVRLSSGSLASVSRLNLLSGSNAAAICNPAGEWEVVQFETAELVDELTYDLSGFLRASAGTDAVMLSGDVPAGAAFVLLSQAVQRIDLTSAQVNLLLNWRYGPANRDIGHSSFAEFGDAFEGIGRRPFSPVHVRGEQNGGDVEISWVRRTRSGGDNWELEDVPLGEETEAYEVDILSSGTVTRTLSSAVTSVTYTSANQFADFGSVQREISCVVYQLSRTWGRGVGREAVLSF